MPTNFVRGAFTFLLGLAALVGLLRLTALRWWQVPDDDPDLGASVGPTLKPGDWLILWRLTAPGPADLVLCPDPEEPGAVFIGRIAGVSGDIVSVKEDGNLEINKVRMRTERACPEPKFITTNPRTGDEVELHCDIETLSGAQHQRATMSVAQSGSGLRPMPTKREVEAGEVFLVSDNRFYPFDSRDFGALPKAACSETIVFRLVSRLGFSHVGSRLSWIQ